MAQDIAETWLPIALARFARTHPGVLVEAKVGRSAPLLDALDQGDLDIALVFSVPGDASERDDCRWRAELPIIWIGSPGWRVQPGLPIPLEHADFQRNRDSQIGWIVIQDVCREKAAGRHDETLF